VGERGAGNKHHLARVDVLSDAGNELGHGGYERLVGPGREFDPHIELLVLSAATLGCAGARSSCRRSRTADGI